MTSHWDALADGTEALEDADVTESPNLDADVLLRHVLDIDRATLFARYDDSVPDEALAVYRSFIERRAAGEPIPYITGRRWFRNLELQVDRRVLIPRPETERLVELALDWLGKHSGPRRVVDVGTGCGAIALALADELGARRDVEIIAGDISQEALAVAETNQQAWRLDGRVEFARSDLLDDIPGAFDVILANLPYLRPDQTHPSTRLEPHVALFGGDDGFELHRRLLEQSVERLRPGGLLVGEIDPDQAERALELARSLFGGGVRIAKDYGGDDRYLIIELNPA